MMGIIHGYATWGEIQQEHDFLMFRIQKLQSHKNKMASSLR